MGEARATGRDGADGDAKDVRLVHGQNGAAGAWAGMCGGCMGRDVRLVVGTHYYASDTMPPISDTIRPIRSKKNVETRADPGLYIFLWLIRN